jgi:hypothetical protein
MVAKKQLPTHIAELRLGKVSVKLTIAAKKQRSAFASKVKAKSSDGATVSSRAGQLIEQTRAAKSAPFTGQYRRVTER